MIIISKKYRRKLNLIYFYFIVAIIWKKLKIDLVYTMEYIIILTIIILFNN